MLTERFPYGSGEAFIDAELRAIAGAFEKVVLVPCSLPSDWPAPREVPSNVEIRVPATTTVGFSRERFRRVIQWILQDYRRWRAFQTNPRMWYALSVYVKKAMSLASSLVPILHDQHSDGVLIYSFWSDVAAHAALLARASLHTNYPVVARAHGWDLYDERRRPELIPLRLPLARELDRLFFVSENGRNYAANRWDLPPSRALVARIPIEPPTQRASACLGDRSGETLRILSCSSTVSVKQLPLMAKAVQIAGEQTSCDFVDWTHIGGPDTEMLAKLAARFPIDIRVRFPGSVTNAEVRKLMAQGPWDVFVNTSSSEGLPVSIVEAMSHSIPIVATDVGGSAEAVLPGGGIVVPATSSAEGVARAIAGIVASPEAHLHFRAGAAQRFETEFRHAELTLLNALSSLLPCDSTKA